MNIRVGLSAAPAASVAAGEGDLGAQPLVHQREADVQLRAQSFVRGHRDLSKKSALSREVVVSARLCYSQDRTSSRLGARPPVGPQGQMVACLGTVTGTEHKMCLRR